MPSLICMAPQCNQLAKQADGFCERHESEYRPPVKVCKDCGDNRPVNSDGYCDMCDQWYEPEPYWDEQDV